jgi:DAACS family dicarboxylate/amino acid:cation (Na+ or H+) symporter
MWLVARGDAASMNRLDRAPDAEVPSEESSPRPFGLPLYACVIAAVLAAIPLGIFLGQDPAPFAEGPAWARGALAAFVTLLDIIPTMIIRALTALAGPLVVLAILSAIVTNEIRGRQGVRMMGFYLVNTIAAMTIGLVLSNLIHPGRNAPLSISTAPAAAEPARRSLRDILVELVPRNIAESFNQNNLAQIVLFTLAIAIGLAQIRNRRSLSDDRSFRTLVDLIAIGFELLMRVLLWVVALVPLAVFGVVATSLAREGIDLFRNLGWFIVTVLAGLACQFALYLFEIGVIGRINPIRFLKGAADVMATTFSTASTAATMPVTLRSLQQKLGVSRESSQLAACVGTNFNNDGTALYQASAVLFFAQAMGQYLSLADQLTIVITTLFASVGAGGIPSGSFVTMPLIFAAVKLDPAQIPILLTIDWFLDRCRTTSNVVGDMTVAILLDRTGRRPAHAQDEAATSSAAGS